jgi:small subunit ribosomal protein S4
MGDPRRLKKKYKKPHTPWDKTRLEEELKYLGDFGLRNKKELYRHRYKLTKFRKLARDLRTRPAGQQKIGFDELIGKLSRLGLVSMNSTPDDVLSLNLEDILNRRLQTLVFKNGFARSIYQARQFIVHKHISVNGKVTNSPSYLVKKKEEDTIKFQTFSPFKMEPTRILSTDKPNKDSVEVGAAEDKK